MRSLEEVLKELKEAEKEYSDKCLKYGIKETTRKKKEELSGNSEENKDNSQRRD